MSDDWGPWIEHDGKGCPCVGMYVRMRGEGWPGQFFECEGWVRHGRGESWNWSFWLSRDFDGVYIGRIVAYQIRKPRSLQQLIDLVENLPVPHRESEDA